MNTTSNPNDPNRPPFTPKSEAEPPKAAESSSEARPAERKGTPFSATLWAQHLRESGWTEATDGVRAIKLPVSSTNSAVPSSPKSKRQEDEELDREWEALPLDIKKALYELTGNQMPESELPKAVEGSSEAGTSEKKGTPFSADLWAEELKARGWRDATMDSGGPTAYELLGSGHSPAKSGSSNQNPPEPLTKEEEAEMLPLVEELVRGVAKKTPDQLIGASLYTGLEGKVGFAIYPTGEISSIFSHAAVGMAGIKLVGNALRHIKANPVKGMWAASFNTRLVVLFTRFCGFKPVARVAFDPAEDSNRTASNPDCRDFEGGYPSTVIYRLDPLNAMPMDAADVLAAFPETMSYADAVALAKAPVAESHTMQ